MKQHLERLLRRQRGGRHYQAEIGSIVAKLTEAEAEALYRLITSSNDDAKADGKRAQARQPWRRP